MATIAATFADPLVDHDPFGRRRDPVTFAQPALIGGTGLIVQEHRHPTNFGQHDLSLDNTVAIPDFHRIWQSDRVVGANVVGGDQHLLHALRQQDSCHRWHIGGPLSVLATGHRDDPVDQDLEGHIGSGGNRGAHGQLATVGVCSIAHVLDQMGRVNERFHPDPLRAFVAHAGDADDVADAFGIHHGDHRRTADACSNDRAVGHLGAGVVGATGTEIRGAAHGERDQIS